MRLYNSSEASRNTSGFARCTIFEAFACVTLDNNASDPWANIANYHTYCHIKVEGEKDWRNYHNSGKYINVKFDCNGESISQRLCADNGLFAMLYQLESPKYKKKYEKKARIKELRQNIKDSKKELVKLAGK